MASVYVGEYLRNATCNGTACAASALVADVNSDSHAWDASSRKLAIEGSDSMDGLFFYCQSLSFDVQKYSP